ncbi:Alpha-N-acetylglucosaminidase [Vitis vinifera]|uniref:Alpha-N-acetylglucosaminidase n=1 Tax=Vitis vinifera TaxID=29760 RepID=A0A438IUF7_VITVI|nr:Alpha-N-acetylglucosaminidase [Vitis vinifera]
MYWCRKRDSYVWWDWERWEKEIDWMALQGVNCLWHLMGKKPFGKKFSCMFQPIDGVHIFSKACLWGHGDFNISKKDLNGFFGGPAFLAWARMGNLHG